MNLSCCFVNQNCKERVMNTVTIPLKLYTALKVAKILKVKKAYVYELVASKRLKAVKLSERRLRIPEAAVDEYIQSAINQ